MANRIVSSSDRDSESTPAIHLIRHASEDQWRNLTCLASANPSVCERARLQAQKNKPKPKKRSRRPRRKSAPSPRRAWQASDVLSRQIAAATIETLRRVNDPPVENAGEQITPEPGFLALPAPSS